MTLTLNPPADMPLTEYRGWLILAGTGVSTRVDFAFRAVTEADGDLRITATDEYTFYALGSPNVAGATVTVSDPFDGRVIRTGTTDATGSLLVASLPAGYYTVTVRADKHQMFNTTLEVKVGDETPLQAFLPGEFVSYTWTVTPTEIPDRTRIVVESTFETNVPAPVVVVEGSIDLSLVSDLTHEAQYAITIRNEGLIAAQGVQIHLPDHPSWELTPLVSEIGVLPAMSSVTIPVIARRVFSSISSAPSPPVTSSKISDRDLALVSSFNTFPPAEAATPAALAAKDVVFDPNPTRALLRAYEDAALFFIAGGLGTFPIAADFLTHFVGPLGFNGSISSCPDQNCPQTTSPKDFGPGTFVSSRVQGSTDFQRLDAEVQKTTTTRRTARSRGFSSIS